MPSEEWECPICHKTVLVGYTAHIYCLDELMKDRSPDATGKEYGMTQKGLDVIDRIIKESPQYKELITEFLSDCNHKGDFYYISTNDYKKWEAKLNE